MKIEWGAYVFAVFAAMLLYGWLVEIASGPDPGLESARLRFRPEFGGQDFTRNQNLWFSYPFFTSGIDLVIITSICKAA